MPEPLYVTYFFSLLKLVAKISVIHRLYQICFGIGPLLYIVLNVPLLRGNLCPSILKEYSISFSFSFVFRIFVFFLNLLLIRFWAS